MFKVHRVGSNGLSIKNLVLLFFTIVLGFASAMTLAQIEISSDINNAWQTIGRITITSGGTNNGATLFDFNYANGKTYINTTGGGVVAAPGNFAGKVLGVDDQGNLIYAYTNNLVVSGGITSGTTILSGSDEDWMIVGNNMYSIPPGNVGIGTTTMNGKLHIKGSGDTDIYIEETAAGNAASLRLQTPGETWIAGGDSNPNVFFIGILGHQEYFTINPLGNVGIGSINPQERLEISGGNVRINNLPNKIVLGTDNNGTIIGSTSGSVYNLISGFILSGPAGPQGATGPAGPQGNTGATGPAGVGSGVGDNLGNHIATQNLEMGSYRIAYNSLDLGLHILSDGRIGISSTIQIANLSGLACNPTNKGTLKYIDNCFQGCNGSNRITLGGTCVGLPPSCGDGILNVPEQCDDGNQASNDGCDSLCVWETPICNFTMNPTTGNIPLQVTFRGTEQNRAMYELKFGNGNSINNQRYFSGTTYVYQTIGGFTPQLIAKNRNHISTQSTCYASGGTTGISVNPSCGDGIISSPEQCDDGNVNGNDGCTALCVRETPSCNFTMNPTTGSTPLEVTFRGTEQNRAAYTINFGNGYGIYDLLTFSGEKYTYQSIGNFIPILTVKNRNHVSTQSTCYASGGTTGISVNNNCSNGIVENGEQCDDGNLSGNDGCTSLCIREIPACSFTMNPTSGTLPLSVTFKGIEQDWAIYGLNFGNGNSISNQRYFSGTTYIYQSTGTVVPQLIAKNRNNLSTQSTCYASGGTTGITISAQIKYCGDGIIQTPNDSGHNEKCDLGSGINSLTGECGITCTYNVPECQIYASPSIFTGGSGTAVLTGTTSPRAKYTISTTPDGLNTGTPIAGETGFNITGGYGSVGTYTITLSSIDGLGVSCSTHVNVYENGEYACGERHKSDQTALNAYDLKLCAPGYKATNFANNSGTISNVGPGKGNKHAIIIPELSSESFSELFNYIDTGKNMITFSGGYYIRFLRVFMSTNINILLPEQGYGYRTRDCVDVNNDKEIVSSCYAHKKINGDCAYDMNIDGTFSSRYFTSGQIQEAVRNSGYLFKCVLADGNGSIEVPEYKFTRGLPAQGGHGNAACQVIPVGPQTEQNLYYLHRVCPGYNYGEPSQSCDSILLSGQGIVSCSGLLAELYTSWGTGGFNTQH